MSKVHTREVSVAIPAISCCDEELQAEEQAGFRPGTVGQIVNSIATNPSRFPGILPTITLSLDFLIFTVIFHKKKKEKKMPQNKKKNKKSSTVQFLMQVFQEGCSYFLGACVEHCFAGGRSVKMSALTKTDYTSQKNNSNNNKQLQWFCSQYKECSVSNKSYMETTPCSIKSVDETSTCHIPRARMG